MTILGAGLGDQIEVRTSGPQARQAIDALKALAENKFGEKDEEASPVTSEKASLLTDTPESPQGAIAGIPASPGIAIGPVVHYSSQMPEVEIRQIQNTQDEIEKLQSALTRASQDLEQLKNQAAKKIGTTEAAIFDVQKIFLDDPALLDAAQEKIVAQQCNAESAPGYPHPGRGRR